MNRRQFLALVSASAAAFPFSQRAQGQSPATSPALPGRKPNFIFLLTDDQRWDALGVVQREMGDRGRFNWIRTPNLDRLASEGVRFRNAFVVNSLCAPSRACFLTGQYSHLNGIANNHTPFSENNVTWPGLLRQQGYTSGYFGKWHMGRQAERPGFDSFASFIGQGRYDDCPFLVDGQVRQQKGWVDDVSTDFALQFVRKNASRPFAMVLGFKSPHGPCTPPQRSRNLYKDAEIRPVPNAESLAPFRDQAAAPGPEFIRNHMRCISAVDDNIGRLLALLDELKIADDTVIVFCGDNGYYFGEHGLGDKRSAYDESLRIPMLVRYPRLAGRGRTLDALALNIDLAPTLLDFAGIAAPAGMQGRTLRPLLEGRPQAPGDWRRAFFYEYFFETGYPQTPTVLAVRTEDAKLIKYPGHDQWTELYDLKADPGEMRNLARDPASGALLQRMQAEFDTQSKAVDYRLPEWADTPGSGPATRPQRNRK